MVCDVDKYNVKSEAWSRASARFLPIRTTGSGAFVYPPPSSALDLIPSWFVSPSPADGCVCVRRLNECACECAAVRVVYPPGPGGPSRLAECRMIASARDVPSPSAVRPPRPRESRLVAPYQKTQKTLGGASPR